MHATFPSTCAWLQSCIQVGSSGVAASHAGQSAQLRSTAVVGPVRLPTGVNMLLMALLPHNYGYRYA